MLFSSTHVKVPMMKNGFRCERRNMDYGCFLDFIFKNLRIGNKLALSTMYELRLWIHVLGATVWVFSKLNTNTLRLLVLEVKNKSPPVVLVTALILILFHAFPIFVLLNPFLFNVPSFLWVVGYHLLIKELYW